MLVQSGLARVGEVGTDASLHSKLNDAWNPFLDKAVEVGFDGVTPAPVERTPLELLQNVHAVIERELGEHAARKRIETALTAFVNHDATEAWLDQFR